MSRALFLAGVRIGVRNSKLENDLKYLWWFWEVRLMCQDWREASRSLRKAWKGMEMASRSKNWPMADSQSGNKDFSHTIVRNWVRLRTWMGLEFDSFPGVPVRNTTLVISIMLYSFTCNNWHHSIWEKSVIVSADTCVSGFLQVLKMPYLWQYPHFLKG